MLAFVGVLLVGGSAGVAAWYVTSSRQRADRHQQSTVATTSTGPATSAGPATFGLDPHVFVVGDCFINTELYPRVALKRAQCGDPAAYRVLKIASGYSLFRSVTGAIDVKATEDVVCAGIPHKSKYSYEHPSDKTRDLFFCLGLGASPSVTGS